MQAPSQMIGNNDIQCVQLPEFTIYVWYQYALLSKVWENMQYHGKHYVWSSEFYTLCNLRLDCYYVSVKSRSSEAKTRQSYYNVLLKDINLI